MFRAFLFCLVPSVLLMGCSTAPKTQAARSTLVDDADMVLRQYRQTDPTVDQFLLSS